MTVNERFSQRPASKKLNGLQRSGPVTFRRGRYRGEHPMLTVLPETPGVFAQFNLSGISATPA
jgi:hypothetical protein